MRVAPSVTRRRGLSIQVCVPKDWSDKQATEFAESEAPCGTELGWQIRRQGSELLAGADERVQCQAIPDYVHITLDA